MMLVNCLSLINFDTRWRRWQSVSLVKLENFPSSHVWIPLHQHSCWGGGGGGFHQLYPAQAAVTAVTNRALEEEYKLCISSIHSNCLPGLPLRRLPPAHLAGRWVLTIQLETLWHWWSLVKLCFNGQIHSDLWNTNESVFQADHSWVQ